MDVGWLILDVVQIVHSRQGDARRHTAAADAVVPARPDKPRARRAVARLVVNRHRVIDHAVIGEKRGVEIRHQTRVGVLHPLVIDDDGHARSVMLVPDLLNIAHPADVPLLRIKWIGRRRLRHIPYWSITGGFRFW